MKNLQFHILVLLIAALSLTGCDDNLTNPSINKDRIIFMSNAENWSNTSMVYSDGTDLKKLTNFYSSRFTISFDREKIIFSANDENGREGIFSMNPNGSEITRITDSTSFNILYRDPQVSIQNSIIFQKVVIGQSSQYSSQISKINIDGSNLINLTNNNEHNVSPLVNPVRNKILFIVVDKGFRIFSMDFDGKNQMPLSDSALVCIGSTENNYSISHDGSMVAFVASCPEYISDLYIMNLDGTDLQNLTHDQEIEYGPTFSKDGSEILFVSKNQLKTISANGGEPKTLITMQGIMYPMYNLSNEKIFFSGKQFTNYDIYSINKDGGDIFNITNSEVDDFLMLVY